MIDFVQKMNSNEHYDEIGRTEDFSMISTMEDGESEAVFMQSHVLL